MSTFNNTNTNATSHLYPVPGGGQRPPLTANNQTDLTTYDQRPVHWNDKSKSGTRLYSIIKPNSTYVSIHFGEDQPNGGVNGIDRLIIQGAFMQLYYTSPWFMEQCNERFVGIHVRNGFHLSNNDTVQHITFCFTEHKFGKFERGSHYHAYFDQKTRMIADITCVQSVNLWGSVPTAMQVEPDEPVEPVTRPGLWEAKDLLRSKPLAQQTTTRWRTM